MYILGLSAFLDDPAAALLCDGKVVAIYEEERLVRVKHGVSYLKAKTITNNERMTKIEDIEVRHFPIQSIDFCLRKAAVELKDIDYIALGFDLNNIVNNNIMYESIFDYLPKFIIQRRLIAFRSYISYLQKLAEEAQAKLVFVRHHIAHTFGALFGSDFNRAIILTLDGMGEFESALLSCFDNGEFEELSSVKLPNSIGRVFSSMTNFLGFKANYDEEKVMALAGYGSDKFNSEFSSLIELTKKGFKIKHEYFWNIDCGMGFRNENLLPTIFGPSRNKNSNPLIGPYKDVARSLQEVLFNVSSGLVESAIEVTDFKNLCMSGGVALNSENNGRLLIENRLEDIYIQPQANDAGVALGSAYYVYYQVTGRRPESLGHVYYGSSFSDEEIQDLLTRYKLRYHYSNDLCHEIAEKLDMGLVVGWFQGATEAGPRALGNRSILASPTVGMDREISLIKDREHWRPFGATIMDEYRGRYLKYDIHLPFMTVSVPLTEKGREELIATQHINRTIRPQTLKRNINTPFYDLIKSYREISGIPALLNTSFNLGGEPIVNTPTEAIADFITSGLDVLVLGNFVSEK